MISRIQNIEDVKVFTRELLAEGINVHPDEDFHDFINADNSAAFTPDEADKMNQLMDECFKICESAGEDIYGLVNEIFQQELANKDQ